MPLPVYHLRRLLVAIAMLLTLAVAGTEVAVILVEQQSGGFKLSFRSRTPKFDCNEMAKSFGGGGHKAAAGAFINFPWPLAQTKVLDALAETNHLLYQHLKPFLVDRGPAQNVARRVIGTWDESMRVPPEAMVSGHAGRVAAVMEFQAAEPVEPLQD